MYGRRRDQAAHSQRRSRRHLPGSRPRADLAAEQGFTFPELAVAASITLIAAVAVMALMLVSIRQNDNQSDRLAALDEARNGMLQMTTEIRGAAALDSVSPQVLDVLVHVPDDPANPYHWIRYKCVGNDQGNSQGFGGTCSRQDKDIHGQDCADDGTGAGCVVILRRVVKYGQEHFAEPCENIDPGSTEEKHFCLKDNRTVALSLFVAVAGAENPIELRDAVTVRNCMHQQEVIPCVSSTPTA